VFVDIDPVTYNINPDLIEQAITKNTKAIMPVHLYGQMADMDAIIAIAKKYDLRVIEDSAQSITSEYKGKKSGSLGDAGCFSFFPSENLGGIGDGGMIVTNDEAIYDRLMIMRNHGSQPKYYHSYIGGNFRLDSIQAAALLVKLPYLNGWSQSRRDNAEYYDNAFVGSNVKVSVISTECTSIYNQYVIRVSRRDALMAHLKENNIGCEIYYPVPMHLQRCFSFLKYKQGDFPEAEKVATEVLAIPIYSELTTEMQAYIVRTIMVFYD